jgi:hypothetical protein
MAWWVFLAAALPFTVPFPFSHRGEGGAVRRVPGLLLLATLVAGNIVVTLLQSRSYVLQAPADNLGELAATVSNARLVGLTGQYDPPWYGQIFLDAYIYYLPLAGILMRDGHIRRRTFWALAILAVALGLSQYTRAPLVQIAVTLLITGLIVFRLNGRKIITWGLIGTISLTCLFVAMQGVLQQANQGGRSFDSAEVYAFGSAKAYETILAGRYPAQVEGLYSFESVEYALKRLGFMSDYPSEIRPYVKIGPYATNTYTFLDAFTLDYGVIGMLLGVGLLGILCVFVERWAFSRGTFPAIVAYSYVVTAMVMSIWNFELGRFGFPLAVSLALLIGALTRSRAGELAQVELTDGVSVGLNRPRILGRSEP